MNSSHLITIALASFGVSAYLSAYPPPTAVEDKAIVKRLVSDPGPKELIPNTNGVIIDGNKLVFPVPLDDNDGPCWDYPKSYAVPATSDAYQYKNGDQSIGYCHLCLVQSGVGDPAKYQGWVRSVADETIGSFQSVSIGRDDPLWFPAGKQTVQIATSPTSSDDYADIAVKFNGSDNESLVQTSASYSDDYGSVRCQMDHIDRAGKLRYISCQFQCVPYAAQGFGDL